MEHRDPILVAIHQNIPLLSKASSLGRWERVGGETEGDENGKGGGGGGEGESEGGKRREEEREAGK